jgi:hypothetical protein
MAATRTSPTGITPAGAIVKGALAGLAGTLAMDLPSST